MLFTKTKLALGLAMLTSFSVAQAETDHYTTWRLSVDSVSLSSDAANQQAIGDGITGLGVALDFKRGQLVGGFGLFGGPVDDDNGFSQLVQDQNGDISVADSSTSAISFFAEAGGSFNYEGKAYLDVVGGFQTLSISRSISNCSDCDSVDLDVDGGLYIKPRVKVPFGDKYLGSLSYTSYLSGDIESALIIGFEGRF